MFCQSSTNTLSSAKSPVNATRERTSVRSNWNCDRSDEGKLSVHGGEVVPPTYACVWA